MSTAAAATNRTFYKMDVQGIVYLVDPVTTIAHTYDLADPTPVGTVQWTDVNVNPRITLYPDWAARLDAKLKAAEDAASATSTTTE
jgi:hypothetical protein